VTGLAASGSSVEPGTLGFLVVAGMGVVLVFLFRSMTKHLRKVSGNGRSGMAASTGAKDGATDTARGNGTADGTGWGNGTADGTGRGNGTADSSKDS